MGGTRSSSPHLQRGAGGICRLAEPAEQPAGIEHVGREPSLVEIRHRLGADHPIGTPLFGGQLFDLDEQRTIPFEKREPRTQIAFDQRVLDEESPRGLRIDRPQRDAPPRHDRQAVQSDPLMNHGRSAPVVPPGVVVRVADQVRGDRLDPGGIDPSHHTAIPARGLDELGSHDPRWGLVKQRGTGPDVQRGPPRSGVFLGVATHRDARQQTGQ